MEKINTNNLIKPFDSLFISSADKEMGDFRLVSLLELVPFKDHPFDPISEVEMDDLMNSIESAGVFTPILIRPVLSEDAYEIVSGHNRVEACRRLKKTTIPAIVHDWDDATATIIMAYSNLRQRKYINPIEMAYSYDKLLNAIKEKMRRGRPSKDAVENGEQNVHNFDGKKSRQILEKELGVHFMKIQRIIRLTKLIPELQRDVKDEKMAVGPSWSLSFLSVEQQQMVKEIIDGLGGIYPSVEQASRMKDLSEKDELEWNTVKSILSEEKAQEKVTVIKSTRLRQYFPDKTPAEMETVIVEQTEGIAALFRYYPKHFTFEQVLEHQLKLVEAWSHRKQQER